MKYYKRANQYKASNVNFDCNTNTAWSYGWWCFFKEIDGVAVFNNFNYSSSTIKHQYKVRDLLEELGYREYMIIEVPCGLQDSDWSAKSVAHYQHKIDELKALISKKGTKKAKNIERLEEIAIHEQKINCIKLLTGRTKLNSNSFKMERSPR